VLFAVGEWGNKEHINLFAHLLNSSDKLSSTIDRFQLRDMALWALLKINRIAPDSYGLQFAKVLGADYTAPPVVYGFSSIEARARGFALCIKNFKELGLLEPPVYEMETSPRFVFQRVEGINADKVQSTSPDGKIGLTVIGNVAWLVDLATNQRRGKPLNAGEVYSSASPKTFTCWCFSPDGTAVVTGSRYTDLDNPKRKPLNNPTDVGSVEVWDTTTGQLIQRYEGGSGGIISVVFKDDKRTVMFTSHPRRRTGP